MLASSECCSWKSQVRAQNKFIRKHRSRAYMKIRTFDPVEFKEQAKLELERQIET